LCEAFPEAVLGLSGDHGDSPGSVRAYTTIAAGIRFVKWEKSEL